MLSSSQIGLHLSLQSPSPPFFVLLCTSAWSLRVALTSHHLPSRFWSFCQQEEVSPEHHARATSPRLGLQTHLSFASWYPSCQGKHNAVKYWTEHALLTRRDRKTSSNCVHGSLRAGGAPQHTKESLLGALLCCSRKDPFPSPPHPTLESEILKAGACLRAPD